MTYKEAVRVLQTVSMFYQNFAMTEQKVKEWALIIQEYEFTDVMENLKNFVGESKFPPTVADLLPKENEEPKSSAYLKIGDETLKVNADQAEEMLKRLEGERFKEIPPLPDFIKPERIRKIKGEE